MRPRRRADPRSVAVAPAGGRRAGRGLAALTAWGTSTGRVEDCGCYGGLVMLTPAQSLALDGVYVALLVSRVAALAPARPDRARRLDVAIVSVAGLLAAARRGLALAAEAARRSGPAARRTDVAPRLADALAARRHRRAALRRLSQPRLSLLQALGAVPERDRGAARPALGRRRDVAPGRRAAADS